MVRTQVALAALVSSGCYIELERKSTRMFGHDWMSFLLILKCIAKVTVSQLMIRLTLWITALSPSFVELLHVTEKGWFAQLFVDNVMLLT
jgi:hypothetical protein